MKTAILLICIVIFYACASSKGTSVKYTLSLSVQKDIKKKSYIELLDSTYNTELDTSLIHINNDRKTDIKSR